MPPDFHEVAAECSALAFRLGQARKVWPPDVLERAAALLAEEEAEDDYRAQALRAIEQAAGIVAEERHSARVYPGRL